MLLDDGINLASVLRGMDKRSAPYLGEIKGALGQVVPGLSGLRVPQSGGFLVIKLRHSGSNGSNLGSTFDLSQESDGTVRLLGLLTALYQERPPSLIGIEEPELTIHPGAQACLRSHAKLRSELHNPQRPDRPRSRAVCSPRLAFLPCGNIWRVHSMEGLGADDSRAFVPIVEGPGDRDAAPILLRRVLYEQMGVSIRCQMAKEGDGQRRTDQTAGEISLPCKEH